MCVERLTWQLHHWVSQVGWEASAFLEISSTEIGKTREGKSVCVYITLLKKAEAAAAAGCGSGLEGCCSGWACNSTVLRTLSACEGTAFLHLPLSRHLQALASWAQPAASCPREERPAAGPQRSLLGAAPGRAAGRTRGSSDQPCSRCAAAAVEARQAARFAPRSSQGPRALRLISAAR